jgi:hypothetical protein
MKNDGPADRGRCGTRPPGLRLVQCVSAVVAIVGTVAIVAMVITVARLPRETIKSAPSADDVPITPTSHLIEAPASSAPSVASAPRPASRGAHGLRAPAPSAARTLAKTDIVDPWKEK